MKGRNDVNLCRKLKYREVSESKPGGHLEETHVKEMESKCKGPEAGRHSANLATDREEGKKSIFIWMIKDGRGPRWQVGMGWG